MIYYDTRNIIAGTFLQLKWQQNKLKYQFMLKLNALKLNKLPQKKSVR